MRFKNIFTFLTTFFNTFKKLFTGKKYIANFQIIENRLQLCRSCEYKSGDRLKIMKCQLCECRIKYKVRFTSSSCPDGKWREVDS